MDWVAVSNNNFKATQYKRMRLARALAPLLTPRYNRPATITSIHFRVMSTAPSPTGSPAPKKVRAEEPNGASTAPAVPIAVAATGAQPKPMQKPQQGKAKRKRNRRYLPDPYSHGDILFRDITDFLGQEYVDVVLAKGDEGEWAAPEDLELQQVVELRAGTLGVNGESQGRRALWSTRTAWTWGIAALT